MKKEGNLLVIGYYQSQQFDQVNFFLRLDRCCVVKRCSKLESRRCKPAATLQIYSNRAVEQSVSTLKRKIAYFTRNLNWW